MSHTLDRFTYLLTYLLTYCRYPSCGHKKVLNTFDINYNAYMIADSSKIYSKHVLFPQKYELNIQAISTKERIDQVPREYKGF